MRKAEGFLDAAAVAEITGGKLVGSGDIQVANVVIDDREAGEGSLYVPIIGERLDGHAFIERAFERGAALTLSDRPLEGSRPYVLVPDTLMALQQIAAYWKAHWHPFTVAVTGSVGKTSTKEMVAAVLSAGRRTLRTEGNLNNQTGVPKTVFGIGPETEAAVIEMGMNHAGEIARLAAIAAPDVGIITNIGTAHIEYLGSREGIFAAKTEMLPYVRPEGLVLACGDDPMLATLRSSVKPPRHVLLYGFSPECDVRAEDVTECGLEGSEATLRLQNGTAVRVRIPAPGRYMIACALAAAACGIETGLSAEQIEQGISSYRPAGARMRIVDTPWVRILDDTYNANAPAMQEALRILAGAPGRRVAILGDMRELGAQSGKLHREVGETAGRLGIDVLCTAGPEAEAIFEAAALPGRAFLDQEALIRDLASFIQPGDTVLVKASRGMELERTVAALEELVF